MFGGVGAGGAGSSTASSSSEDEDSLSLEVSELEKANAAGLCLCGREGAALSTELASASDDKLSASARFICREDIGGRVVLLPLFFHSNSSSTLTLF